LDKRLNKPKNVEVIPVVRMGINFRKQHQEKCGRHTEIIWQDQGIKGH